MNNGTYSLPRRAQIPSHPRRVDGKQRQWRDHVRGRVAVAQEFGAIGDGVTDDSIAIQAALNALERKGGGTLYLPNTRQPYIAKGLRWPSFVMIVGDGEGDATRLQLPDGANTYLIASHTWVENSNACSFGQRMSNLQILGNKANQSVAVPAVIMNSFRGQFDRCSIWRSKGRGLLITVKNSAGGNTVGIAETRITDSSFNECENEGIYCENNANDSLADIFIRCCALNTNGIAGGKNIKSERSAGFQFAFNQVYSGGDGSALFDNAGRCQIIGNNFDTFPEDPQHDVEVFMNGHGQLTYVGNVHNDIRSSTAHNPASLLHLFKAGGSIGSVIIDGNSFAFDTLTSANATAISQSSFASGEIWLGINSFDPVTTGPVGEDRGTHRFTAFMRAMGGLLVNTTSMYLPNIGSGTGTALHAVTGDNNRVILQTSAARYKRDIEDMDRRRAVQLIRSLRPIWYRDATGNSRQDWSWDGLLAEEVAALDPRYVDFDADGQPMSVDYARLVVPLLTTVQGQDRRIEELEKRLRDAGRN